MVNEAIRSQISEDPSIKSPGGNLTPGLIWILMDSIAYCFLSSLPQSASPREACHSAEHTGAHRAWLRDGNTGVVIGAMEFYFGKIWC